MQSISGSASNNLRFPGQYFLLESGLAYNWHRHYDPTLGRYIQPDPLDFVDGPSIYAYAGSSPAMYVDPDGMNVGALGVVAGVSLGPVGMAAAAVVGTIATVAAADWVWKYYSKSTESKPVDCPPGTVPIDAMKKKLGLDKEDVHDIKEGVEARTKDCTSDKNGRGINNGPWQSLVK